MKPDIHPTYRPVVFEDTSTGDRLLTRSTIATDATTQWTDGAEYPHVVVDISSYSHPFYTGKMKIVDTAGRVERFTRRHGERHR
jgi:large subunit ribosomal protein L31